MNHKVKRKLLRSTSQRQVAVFKSLDLLIGNSLNKGTSTARIKLRIVRKMRSFGSGAFGVCNGYVFRNVLESDRGIKRVVTKRGERKMNVDIKIVIFFVITSFVIGMIFPIMIVDIYGIQDSYRELSNAGVGIGWSAGESYYDCVHLRDINSEVCYDMVVQDICKSGLSHYLHGCKGEIQND